MRWRVIALVSLGVNLALVAAYVLLSHQQAAKVAAAVAAVAKPPLVQTNTTLVASRQPFLWREIESPDYATYILNLRDIGCPEQTIRDIIIADVNMLYSRRRATELVTAEQQWWRSEADTNLEQAALEKAQELEHERRSLLTRLLGTNWETGDMVSIPRPSRVGVILDGPVLGVLPAETKQAIQDVCQRLQDRAQAYLEAQRAAGKDPDPVELAKLDQQVRTELAGVLSPPALEEYLLRYSPNANDLRGEFGQLQFFNCSSNEFRDVFRATDALDQRIRLLANATDPGSVAARQALETQRENAINTALGHERYEEFLRLQDPHYREAFAEAGNTEDALKLYFINAVARDETNSILTDTNLTATQKRLKLKAAELDELRAKALATGEELPPEPPPPGPPPKKVVVRGPGDSAASIALMYGLPVSALKAANPKVDFNRLKPGVEIVIPPSPYSPTPMR